MRNRRLKLRAASGLANMTEGTDPFVFPDMPDEAVVAIDQFLEARYNDPMSSRPLDDPPF